MRESGPGNERAGVRSEGNLGILWNGCSHSEFVFETNTHCFVWNTGETGDIDSVDSWAPRQLYL